MESLHINLLVDKQQRRQVALLAMFIDEASIINLKDASSRLGVTTKTVNKDLRDLKAQLPYTMEFKQHANSIVELICDNDFCQEKFLFHLISQSPLYRLLDGIFSGERVSNTEWAGRFFVSETTCRQYVNQLNSKVLQHYGIQIGQNCLTLLGNEKDVRRFYFDLYFGFKNYIHVSTIDERYFKIIKEMKRINEMAFSGLYIDCYRYAGWLMISIQRCIARCDVFMRPTHVTQIKSQEQYHVFSHALTNAMLKIYPYFKLKEYELMYLYTMLLHAVVYAAENSGESSVSNYTRLPNKNYDSFEKFVSNTLKNLYSNEKTFDIAVERHCALLCNIFQLSTVSKDYQIVTQDVHKYVHELHNKIYVDWLTALEEHKHIKSLRFKYLEDVAISLSILTIAFIYEYKHIDGHILLCFTGETARVNLLTLICRTLVPTNVTVTLKFDSIINQAYVNEHNVNLVVCNYDLGNVLSVPIYRVPNLPDLEECAKLKTVIMSVI